MKRRSPERRFNEIGRCQKIECFSYFGCVLKERQAS